MTPTEHTKAAMLRHFGFPPLEGDWKPDVETGYPGLGTVIEEQIATALFQEKLSTLKWCAEQAKYLNTITNINDEIRRMELASAVAKVILK